MKVRRAMPVPGMSMPGDALDLNDIEYDAYLAVDGNSVKRIPMAQAKGVDVILTIPSDRGAFVIHAQREGDRRWACWLGRLEARASVVVSRVVVIPILSHHRRRMAAD